MRRFESTSQRFKQLAVVIIILAFSKFRQIRQNCKSDLGKMIKSRSVFLILLWFKNSEICFVFEKFAEFKKLSLTKIWLEEVLRKAKNVAYRRAFLFIFLLTSFGFGPKITPPPTHSGERLDPARALPVPFWRQGFLPPPRISDFVFVEAV